MSHSPQAATRGEPGYVWRSGQERRLAMIRRWCDLSGRILDNGCGLGTYLAAFAPYSDHRFGLEVEWERARQARTSAEGIVQGVGERLPFAADLFDFVLSNEVIEHVADDALYARETVRVTRPGGRILIFAPNRWYPVEQQPCEVTVARSAPAAMSCFAVALVAHLGATSVSNASASTVCKPAWDCAPNPLVV